MSDETNSMTLIEQAIADLAAQLYYGQSITPEYSTSKGWLPVDIDTKSKNLDYVDDLAYRSADPLFAALTGGQIDPAAFDPVRHDIERPDVPIADRWANYQELSDPITGTFVHLLNAGQMPLVAARTAVMEYPEAAGIAELEGEELQKAIDDIAGSMVKQGEDYLDQRQQLAAWEAQPYYEEESETAKLFREAGLPRPDELFGPEHFADSREAPLLDKARKEDAAYDRRGEQIAKFEAEQSALREQIALRRLVEDQALALQDAAKGPDGKVHGTPESEDERAWRSAVDDPMEGQRGEEGTPWEATEGLLETAWEERLRAAEAASPWGDAAQQQASSEGSQARPSGFSEGRPDWRGPANSGPSRNSRFQGHSTTAPGGSVRSFGHRPRPNHVNDSGAYARKQQLQNSGGNNVDEQAEWKKTWQAREAASAAARFGYTPLQVALHQRLGGFGNG